MSEIAMSNSKSYVWGLHAARSVLANHPHLASEIFFDASRKDNKLNELRSLAKKCSCPINEVAKKELASMLITECRHQGVVVILSEATPKAKTLSELIANATFASAQLFLVVFDRVLDPRNLGACLRAADAMGADAAIITKHQTAPISATTKKAASGATIPLLAVASLSATIETLQAAHIHCVATVDNASGERNTSPLTSMQANQSIALFFGSEESGLRPLIIARCNQAVTIPMSGSVPSLNVSVACGVACYEVNRQRSNQKAG